MLALSKLRGADLVGDQLLGKIIFQAVQVIAFPFQLLRKGFFRKRQDLDGQIAGVLRPVDRHGGDRNTGRHLHGRKQGIHALKHRSLAGNPDHGKSGICRHRSRKMCCHAGCGNDHAEALFPCRKGKASRFFRGPVRRIDVHLIRHAKLCEHCSRLFYHGQITFAAHYNSDFFHLFSLVLVGNDVFSIKKPRPKTEYYFS